MRNKKLKLTLASSFVGLIALSACSSVSFKENAIVTFTDANGNEIPVLTNTIYNKYRDSSDGISKFYTSILESIIRYQFDSSTETIWKKSNKQIKEEAQNDVEGRKEDATDAAEKNNTSWQEEWEKILKSHNAENEEELLQHFIYEKEKEEIEDWYLFNHKEDLTAQYLGIDKDGNAYSWDDEEKSVKSCYPYHIRHMLVSVSGGATNFINGTITEEEAKGLAQGINYLTDEHYTFSEAVLQCPSSTDGSKTSGGELDIMTTTTSFVNEFKLGIYAFDAIESRKAQDRNLNIEKGLGINDKYKVTTEDGDKSIKEYLNGLEVPSVPYGAFAILNEYANVVKDDFGKVVNEDNSAYYPRNIIWNQYLNHHEPFVITDEKLDKNGMPVVDPSLDGNTKFVNHILTDGEGHTIIGVRSEHGIHFMIIQKSIFDFGESGDQIKESSLEEYYTTYTPLDDEYPTWVDSTEYHLEHDKETYVNFIKTPDDPSKYITRAKKVKDAIKGFDSTYDYRLYEYLVDNNQIIFNDTDGKDLGEKIANYLKVTREKNRNDADKTMNEAWRTYIELLESQNIARKQTYKVDGTTYTRMVPVRCAVGFKKHTGSDWEKGGQCYYAKDAE